ncbi:MAG: hypothetical protein HGA85_08180, partial [Nanoarchaeota archaeon]|nr:hypothetical protein [Nanoarchaeota archaeon]
MTAETKPKRKIFGNIIFGLIIIVLGAGLLLQNMNVFPWFTFSLVWPVVLVLLGLGAVFKGHGKSKPILALILISIGALLLLKYFGYINFELWESFKTFWPVGVILVGISMIFRKGWFPLAVFVLLVVGGAFFFKDKTTPTAYREYSQDLGYFGGIDTMQLKVYYGGGTLNISNGTPAYFLKHDIHSNLAAKPDIEYW